MPSSSSMANDKPIVGGNRTKKGGRKKKSKSLSSNNDDTTSNYHRRRKQKLKRNKSHRSAGDDSSSSDDAQQQQKQQRQNHCQDLLNGSPPTQEGTISYDPTKTATAHHRIPQRTQSLHLPSSAFYSSGSSNGYSSNNFDDDDDDDDDDDNYSRHMVDTVYSSSKYSTRSTNTEQSRVRRMHSAGHRNPVMKSLEKEYAKQIQQQKRSKQKEEDNKINAENTVQDEQMERQEQLALQFERSQIQSNIELEQQKIDERKRAVDEQRRKLKARQERKKQELEEKKLALEKRHQKLKQEKEEEIKRKQALIEEKEKELADRKTKQKKQQQQAAAETELIAKEKQQRQQRKAQAEAERIANEKQQQAAAEMERIAKEKKALEEEKARLHAETEARLAEAKAEADRISREVAEAERLKAEREVLAAKEKAEQERLARENAEKERLKAQEELRILKQQAEQERLNREQAEKERIQKEKQAEVRRIALEKVREEEATRKAQEELKEIERKRKMEELDEQLKQQEIEMAQKEAQDHLRKELDLQRQELEEKRRILEEEALEQQRKLKEAELQQRKEVEEEVKRELELQRQELEEKERKLAEAELEQQRKFEQQQQHHHQQQQQREVEEEVVKLNGQDSMSSKVEEKQRTSDTTSTAVTTVRSTSSEEEDLKSYDENIKEDFYSDNDAQQQDLNSVSDDDYESENLPKTTKKSTQKNSKSKLSAKERKRQLLAKKHELEDKRRQLELEYSSGQSSADSNDDDDHADDSSDNEDSSEAELQSIKAKRSSSSKTSKKKKNNSPESSARDRKRQLEGQYGSSCDDKSMSDDDESDEDSFGVEALSKPLKGSDHSSPMPTSQDEASKLRKAFEEGMKRGMSVRNMNSSSRSPPPPVRKALSLDPSQQQTGPGMMQRGMSLRNVNPMSRTHLEFQNSMRNNSMHGRGRGMRQQRSMRSLNNLNASLHSTSSRGMGNGMGPPTFPGRGTGRGGRPGFGRANTMQFGKAPSHRSIGARSRSVNQMERPSSARLIDFTIDEEQPVRPKSIRKGIHDDRKKNKMEMEHPPRSIVLIWVVVAGELGFDLGTTIIAFRSLVEEDDCCGRQITVGPIPMSLTAPFFLLVVAELALLIRAIVMTLFPNWIKPMDDKDDDDDDDDEEEKEEEDDVIDEEEVEGGEKKAKKKKKQRSAFMRFCCCYLKWKVRFIMHVLGLLVILNPFFGCLIAWMLLYQSDKKDALTVLGFEGGSLLLHYIAVYLEGSITNCISFIMQGIVPLIPFTVGVGLALFYLKQGGICYVVDDELFKFNGCEVCANGYPPDNGICYFPNGTNYTFDPVNSLSAENLNSLDGLIGRTYQVSYCQSENPGGPETDFCFFDFEEGKLPGTVVNRTVAPTQVFSTNACGGIVSSGPRLSQCQKYLWGPTDDNSMHCLASGGNGDPCQLSIKYDGSEGRFKDPSDCTIETYEGGYRSYADVLFLWDEPDMNGKDYSWAGNSWLAYSARRYAAELTRLREEGLKVTSALFKLEDPSDFRANVGSFFDNCRPLCNDPNSTSYVDIIAANVLCNYEEDPFCRNTAESATSLLKSVSEEHGNRPVFITKWGMTGTEEPENLARAMRAIDAFFIDGSPVRRIYWYGGDRFDTTNLLFQARPGTSDTLSLGDLWVEQCNDLGLLF